jgi:hypothetical protein
MQVLKRDLIAIRITHDGDHVQLVVNGALVFNIPWQQALDVSRAIHQHAKRAEETAKAEQIIHQEAALMRSGAPLSLVTRWDMKREAGKEAAWGWVRRYLPNRIRQTGHVFAPTVRQLPPKGE